MEGAVTAATLEEAHTADAMASEGEERGLATVQTEGEGGGCGGEQLHFDRGERARSVELGGSSADKDLGV